MEKTRAGRIRKKELMAEIMKFFQEEPGRAFNYQQVSNVFGLTKQALKVLVAECLSELSLQDYLIEVSTCLLYTSDAADELDGVDLGGRRIIKKNIFVREWGG
jgi:DNA-binding PucR family transcriptional regulator